MPRKDKYMKNNSFITTDRNGREHFVMYQGNGKWVCCNTDTELLPWFNLN